VFIYIIIHLALKTTDLRFYCSTDFCEMNMLIKDEYTYSYPADLSKKYFLSCCRFSRSEMDDTGP